MLRFVIACAVGAAVATSALPVFAAPAADDWAAAMARGDAAAEASDDEAALAAYRAAYARRPPADEIARRDLLRRIGRVEAHRFEVTGDVVSLRRAEASLVDALDACGDDAPTCAAIEVELQDVRRKLPAEERPGGAPTTAAAPPVAPPVAIVPVASPGAPPADVIARQQSLKAADGVAITGAVFAGAGLAALLFLAAPAGIAAQVAEDRAADDPVLVSESELHRRADARRRFARISAISGGGGLLLGGIMLGAGLGARHRINHRPTASAQLVPGGAGVSVTGRF